MTQALPRELSTGMDACPVQACWPSLKVCRRRPVSHRSVYSHRVTLDLTVLRRRCGEGITCHPGCHQGEELTGVQHLLQISDRPTSWETHVPAPPTPLAKYAEGEPWVQHQPQPSPGTRGWQQWSWFLSPFLPPHCKTKSLGFSHSRNLVLPSFLDCQAKSSLYSPPCGPVTPRSPDVSRAWGTTGYGSEPSQSCMVLTFVLKRWIPPCVLDHTKFWGV